MTKLNNIINNNNKFYKLLIFSNMSDEKTKKLNQKFKNVFNQKILSSTWEKEGIEVSD